MLPANITRDKFLQSYIYLQNFPFSDPLVFYITKNPSNPKVYQKLIQCCKHFFVQNPILVFECLCYKPYFDGRKICEKGRNPCSSMVYFDERPNKHPYNLNNIPNKIWISNKFCLDFMTQQFHISTLISKFYRCDIRELKISNQFIEFQNFLKISLTVEICFLNQVQIYEHNNSYANVPLEKIIEHCPKIQQLSLLFYYSTCHRKCTSITSKTVENLVKLPQFLQLKLFIAKNLPETFDIQTFFNFIKNNKTTFMQMYFRSHLSIGYRNQLDAVIDEIGGTETFHYIPPLIHYPDINVEKYRAIKNCSTEALRKFYTNQKK